MTKLLILGAAVAILLMWQEMWLHAAVFTVGYCGFLELWHIAKKIQSDTAHIDLMRRSLHGLRRAHRRGH